MPKYVRAAERREQLLDAAVEVLVRDGLDAMTLRDVAAQAGVRLSTLQYIFSSRAELIAALAERVLVDARYGQFEVGSGGLEHELRRLVDWFATQFFADPAMVELVRHEYLARFRRRDPQEPVDHPAGWPIVSFNAGHRFAEIAAKAQEEYDLTPEALARMWTLAQMGLIVEYLQDRDVDRHQRDALFVVDRIVDVARPRRTGAAPGTPGRPGTGG
jgi:AcrR family transcriptional regulator